MVLWFLNNEIDKGNKYLILEINKDDLYIDDWFFWEVDGIILIINNCFLVLSNCEIVDEENVIINVIILIINNCLLVLGNCEIIDKENELIRF